ERAANRVRRAVRPRLTYVSEVDAERSAVAEQLLDPLGQVPGHDGDPRAARSGEVADEGGHDRPAVDRQDRPRPALAARAEAAALARGQHDRVRHRPLALAGGSEQRNGFVEDNRRDLRLRRLRDAPLARTRDQDNLVARRVEADVVARHVVEDDEIDTLL